jgi:chromatin remodeling complex protein RSC6
MYILHINNLRMAKTVNAALSKPLNLTPELEAVVGKGPMPRTEVVKQMWVYIKKHNLQNPSNKRNILADDKLRPIFGKDEVTMFEMTKLASAHMK